MNERMNAGFGIRRRAALAAWMAAAVLLLAGAGPAAAQGTFYADLDAAVPDLASRLVENDRLEGKKVLVNVHDFFEERTGHNLPLSETLRQRFRTELSSLGVQVFALPEGSEDDMVILQGVWRELPGPGVRPESRKIDLVVSLIERTGDGQQVLPAARGRVDAVDEVLLTPDLDSWGRHLVRELETVAGGRGRRVVQLRNIDVDGVDEPERLKKYLVRRWLFPAFSQSRLFRLARAEGAPSGGALDADVFVHADHVEIALHVEGKGGLPASATISMTKTQIPSDMVELDDGADVRNVAIESGIVNMWHEEFPDLQRKGICSDTRGIKNRRIDFEVPFHEPPRVIVALKVLDVGNDANLRINANVVNTDNHGFNYDLISWCDTVIHWIQMSWIAHGYR